MPYTRGQYPIPTPGIITKAGISNHDCELGYPNGADDFVRATHESRDLMHLGSGGWQFDWRRSRTSFIWLLLFSGLIEGIACWGSGVQVIDQATGACGGRGDRVPRASSTGSALNFVSQ